MEEKKKIMIIDGNSLAHRAFYALPLLTNRQGVFTNAVYGFTTMLLKVLKEEQPGYAVVAFDKGKTFRHERFESYKGQRKPTPQELRPQFPLIHRVLQALKISIMQLEGFEADDLIGTIATQAEQAGYEIIIVTGDRDSLQLVSENITAMITRKGISIMEKYDLQTIQEKYCLQPLQLRDVKGLMGDASDNIPGVPGIGEKTAVKLIQEYGSIENIFINLEEMANKKLAEKIRPYQDQAILSKELGSIACTAPLEIDFSALRLQEPDYSQLLEVLRELEFNSLLKDFLGRIKAGETDNTEAVKTEHCELLTSREEFMKVAACKDINKLAVALSFDSKNYLKAKAIAAGLAWEQGAIGIRCDDWDEADLRQFLAAVFSQPGKEIIIHDLKSCLVFAKKRGISYQSAGCDTMLAAYLLNPSASGYDLTSLSLEHLNQAIVPSEKIAREMAQQARIIWQLNGVLEDKLLSTEMYALYKEVELPLAEVLGEMELNGVKLDQVQLQVMGQKLLLGIEALTEEIYKMAGEEFNINSPKQLAAILFDKLGLPPLKKTKTGYSTNAEVLEELAEKHEIVAKILEYRQLAKLKSTYIDGLLTLIDPHTGKVHTTFNQTITATGRLSSTEPNLQNIPIRLEAGRLLRKAFIPSKPGFLLLAADYSQIELRVLADMSGDPGLIDAFNKDHDIHTRTASEVFGVPMEEVTREMRRRAKAVNFGIVYGISDFGLSRDLGIPINEAKQYIELYFRRYPGVKHYLEQVINSAREQGYVTTLLHRRRYLPDIYSTNRNIRSFGERAAMNTPIQGSAADIIKLAMLKVHHELCKAGLKTAMLLQVHDELIFEVPAGEMETAQNLIRQAMEKAYKLKVPLKVDMKFGSNWYDMQDI